MFHPETYFEHPARESKLLTKAQGTGIPTAWNPVAPANLDARKRQKTACSSFLSSCRKDPGFPTVPGNKRLEKDEDNSTLGHLHVGLHLMGGNGSGIQGKDCRGGGERAANTEKQTSRREEARPWLAAGLSGVPCVLHPIQRAAF